MPTKEQLETALINADKAGDTDAARKLANALKAGAFEESDSDTQMPTAPTAPNPVLAGAAEFAAGANNAVVELLDFLGPDQINNILQLAGSEKRFPTLGEQDIIRSATSGGFVENDLARDVLRSAGSMTTAGGLGGQVLRQGANQIPKLASNSESVLAGVLRQIKASSPALDFGAGAVAGAGSELGGEAGEQVAGQEGRAAGEMIGAVVAPLAIPAKLSGAGAVSSTVRRAIRPDAQKVASTIDDFKAVGSTPTVGQATGSANLQSAENLSAKVAGGNPIVKAAENVQSNIQRRLRVLADTASPREGLDVAGRTLKSGITGQGGFIDRFQARSSLLWGKVDDLIAPDAVTSMASTKETLNKLVSTGDFAKVLNNPKLAQLKGIIDDASGNPSFQELRNLRSTVGRELAGTDLSPDIPRAQLKQLYAALSNDVKAVAEASSPAAVKAWTRANNHTRAGHERLGGYVERIANKGDLQKVYEAVVRGTEDVATINAFKRSLKPEEWNVVASNALRQMGKANPGQQNAEGDAFSVAKFLTDWNRLGPKARKAIFSGTPQLNKLGKDLDKIARVSESVKESAKAAANPSGTGQAIINTSAGLTAAGATLSGNVPLAGGILSVVAANNSAARLMTSPRFVNWLARTPSNPAKLQAHISALETVAKNSSLDDAMAIYDLINDLGEE